MVTNICLSILPHNISHVLKFDAAGSLTTTSPKKTLTDWNFFWYFCWEEIPILLADFTHNVHYVVLWLYSLFTWFIWENYLSSYLRKLWILSSISSNIPFVMYLDSREGDSRGGVRTNHQRHDGGAQRTKHVGELQGQRRGEIRNDIYRHIRCQLLH